MAHSKLTGFTAIALAVLLLCGSSARAQMIDGSSLPDSQQNNQPNQYQQYQQEAPPQPVQPRSAGEWFSYLDQVRRRCEVSPDAENRMFYLLTQPGPLNPDDQDLVNDVMKHYQKGVMDMQRFLPISATERLHKSYADIIGQKFSLARDLMQVQNDPSMAAQYGQQLGETVKRRRAEIGQLQRSFGSLEQNIRQYYQVAPPQAQQQEEEQ